MYIYLHCPSAVNNQIKHDWICCGMEYVPWRWSARWTWSTWDGRGWCRRQGWSADSSCPCRRTQTDSTWDSALRGRAGKTIPCKTVSGNLFKRECEFKGVCVHWISQQTGLTTTIFLYYYPFTLLLCKKDWTHAAPPNELPFLVSSHHSTTCPLDPIPSYLLPSIVLFPRPSHEHLFDHWLFPKHLSSSESKPTMNPSDMEESKDWSLL